MDRGLSSVGRSPSKMVIPMAEFAPAAQVMLLHEGCYSDNPNDLGGPTKYGITLKFYQVAVRPTATKETIAALGLAEALELYRKFFWAPLGLDQLTSQTIATKIFDMDVNMRPGQAIKLVQEALNDLGNQVDVDGLLGPQTRAAIEASDPEGLIVKIVARQSDFYRALVEQNPRDEEFLVGWLERAAWPLAEKPNV